MKIFNILAFILYFNSAVFSQSNYGAGTKYNKQYVGGLNNGGQPSYIHSLNRGKANFIVSNSKDLIHALSVAKAGDKIYINKGVSLNLTGYKGLKVKTGVTIYGDRGVNGSKGPLIYTESHGVAPLFDVVGDNVTFFGIRIRGADGAKLYKDKDAFAGKTNKQKKESYLKLFKQNMHATAVSSGIATTKNNLIIENCELSQWTHTAIYLKKGATNAIVRNNYIHHNQRFGLGYGVTIDQSTATIVGNLFNYNRHSVASTGTVGSRYTVEYNVFKEGGNESWAVDMHGGKDRGDGTSIAGTRAIVKNNTFYLKGSGQAFVIRGTSKEVSEVTNNKIVRLDNSKIDFIQQRNSKGNLKRASNLVIQGNVEKVVQ